MSVKIRLRRTGRKKQPTYRIVISDSRSPRDGKFIEVVGQYAPRQGEQALNLKSERVNYWLDNGAQPSDTVRSLLRIVHFDTNAPRAPCARTTPAELGSS